MHIKNNRIEMHQNAYLFQGVAPFQITVGVQV